MLPVSMPRQLFRHTHIHLLFVSQLGFMKIRQYYHGLAWSEQPCWLAKACKIHLLILLRLRRKEKMNFTRFGQPTRLLTCAKPWQQCPIFMVCNQSIK